MKTYSILLPFMLFLSLSYSQRVERIGNEILATQSGVDNPGATILLNDKALRRGILFAFAAFFRSLKPAVFQIWRPTVASNQFMLISQTRIMPTVENQREDIYIASLLNQKCLVIKNEDKLGLYTEESPAPVAYKFNAQNPTSLMNQNPNVSDPYIVGDVVNFDSLAFPYALSVAAYIDTLVDNDTIAEEYVDCPKDLLIPENESPTLPTTSPTPPPTGKPGDTGATGPQGDTGFTGARGMAGMNGTMGSTGATGMMGYNGTHGMDGATGATGPTGDAGATGATGPMGATGSMGPKGETGMKGDDGEDGRDGKDGINGTWIYVRESEAKPVSDENMWMNPLLIMILVIWLIIVTVILLILTCAFCCYACRSKDRDDEPSQYSHNNGVKDSTYVNVGFSSGESESDHKNLNRLSSYEPGQDWIKGMKADDTMNYSHDTIERADSNNPSKPEPLSNIQPHIYDDDMDRRIPKTPDNVLTDKTAVDVNNEPASPDSADVPFPPPPPAVSTSPDPQSPTTPPARWSQSQEQLTNY